MRGKDIHRDRWYRVKFGFGDYRVARMIVPGNLFLFRDAAGNAINVPSRDVDRVATPDEIPGNPLAVAPEQDTPALAVQNPKRKVFPKWSGGTMLEFHVFPNGYTPGARPIVVQANVLPGCVDNVRALLDAMIGTGG